MCIFIMVVGLQKGRREIAPTRNCTHIFRNVLNLFVCIKLDFFLQFSYLCLIYSLGGNNKIKHASGDYKFNFKKVGAIPSEPSKN